MKFTLRPKKKEQPKPELELVFTRPGLHVDRVLIFNEFDRASRPEAEDGIRDLDGRIALAMIENNREQETGL